jgi:hypothetical protein
MTRKEELLSIVCKTDESNRIKAEQLIDEVIFIEEQLIELKKLPFVLVDKKNNARQKATAASRQYKELLQQYNNSLKLLLKMAGEFGETEETSPLREWAKKRKDSD